MERNGKASSGKRTRHININYFFITDGTDGVNMKKVTIEWCPTKMMVAHFMTKPLQGSHFRNLRDYIMGKVHNMKHNNDATKTASSVKDQQQVHAQDDRQAPCQVSGTVIISHCTQECTGV